MLRNSGNSWFAFAVGRVVLSLMSLALLPRVSSAQAADGYFDSTFQLGGHLLLEVSSGPKDQGSTLAIQPDGKLLMAGTCANPENGGGMIYLAPTFCATRLRPDGSYDTSFGPGGVGYLRFDRFTNWENNSRLADMAHLSDGRMVFFGTPTDGSMMLLAVLQADGATLDPSVGSGNGFLIFQFNGTRSGAAKVLQQADGKVLIAGTAIGPNGNLDMAVARFLPDFSGFDPTFGAGGYRTIAFDLGGPSGDNSDFVDAMALQSDGRIVIAGIAYTNAVSAPPTGNSAIVRLLANGQLDTSFGPNQDGRVHFAPASVGFPAAVLVDRQSRIILGGYGPDPSNTYGEWSIDRLLPDGSQDPGFNGGSSLLFLVRPGLTAGYQSVSALTLQSDGKILAAGVAAHDSGDSPQYWGAARLLSDGTLDPAFGPGVYYGAPGRSYGSFAPGPVLGYADYGTAIAVGNGGILVAGFGQQNMSGTGSKVSFGLAKLQLDLIFSDGFE